MKKTKKIATEFVKWMSDYSVSTIKKEGWLWSKSGEDKPERTTEELYNKFINEKNEKEI